jgi:hypothetical protein
MPPNTGKYAWQITGTTIGNTVRFGMVDFLDASSWTNEGGDKSQAPSGASGIFFEMDASGSGSGMYKGVSGTQSAVDTSADAKTFVSSEVAEFLYDSDNGTFDAKIGGVSLTQATGLPAVTYIPHIACYNSTLDVDCGQNGYTPSDASYFPLATQNLPTPSVNPSDHAEVLLYEGTGAAQDIIGQDWGGDDELLVLKNRDQADSWKWMDTLRGAGQSIQSNNTDAESDESASHTAFNNDGFSLAGTDGSFNTSSESYMALRIRAGTSGINNDGSITSTVSANQTSGFSIVTYTGNSSASTVGHGLGVAPAMVIVKKRSGAANDWAVWNKNLSVDQILLLNSTAAAYDPADNDFQDTAPTSSVFYITATNGRTNSSGEDFVAYCFADVADLATSIFRIGSWDGNSSTDGPMNTLDASTKFLLWKQSTGGNEWYALNNVVNPNNVTQNALIPSNSAAEITSLTQMDFLSNGFKCRSSDGLMNATGSTYIYLQIIDKFVAGGAEAVTQGRAR